MSLVFHMPTSGCVFLLVLWNLFSVRSSAVVLAVYSTDLLVSDILFPMPFYVPFSLVV
jgi:hypothetical protein